MRPIRLTFGARLNDRDVFVRAVVDELSPLSWWVDSATYDDEQGGDVPTELLTDDVIASWTERAAEEALDVARARAEYAAEAREDR